MLAVLKSDITTYVHWSLVLFNGVAAVIIASIKQLRQ